MANEMKYIVIGQKQTISYDDDKCLLDGKEIKDDFGGLASSEEFAKAKQKEFYNSFFQKHYQNIVVLAAAGTSLDNDAGDDKTHRGKTRKQLWDACKVKIDAFKADIADLDNKPFYKLKDDEGNALDYGDIEELLSYLILYNKANEKGAGFEQKIKDLEEEIAENCKLELQSDAPHKAFLNKITARKPSDSRVKLFTTNYDTLFEQAANNAGFTIVDGFSYTQPRVFSGRYFDYDFVNRERSRLKNEESFVTKVFHLYKLHGSLTWEKEAGKERIIQKEKPDNPLIIYPASNKYESSYEQPYFEMMSRFQQALREDNVLLIIIGFGFKDKHIQSAILEAVEQNPSFQLVVVDYNGNNTINKNNLKDFFEGGDLSKIKRNVTVIFDKFKDFTEKYPENETYREEPKLLSDESVR